jgi:hypothetical protein
MEDQAAGMASVAVVLLCAAWACDCTAWACNCTACAWQLHCLGLPRQLHCLSLPLLLPRLACCLAVPIHRWHQKLLHCPSCQLRCAAGGAVTALWWPHAAARLLQRPPLQPSRHCSCCCWSAAGAPAEPTPACCTNGRRLLLSDRLAGPDGWALPPGHPAARRLMLPPRAGLCGARGWTRVQPRAAAAAAASAPAPGSHSCQPAIRAASAPSALFPRRLSRGAPPRRSSWDRQREKKVGMRGCCCSPPRRPGSTACPG